MMRRPTTGPRNRVGTRSIIVLARPAGVLERKVRFIVSDLDRASHTIMGVDSDCQDMFCRFVLTLLFGRSPCHVSEEPSYHPFHPTDLGRRLVKYRHKIGMILLC